MQNERQLKKRKLILTGSLWKAILVVAIPILVYNLCNYLYGIFDMLVVQKAHIGDTADIVVLDQIKNMISTVGGALATGGGILISRRYGEGAIDKSRRAANCLFTLALIVTLITLIFIPLGKPFLILLKTDETTISNAMGYFYVQIAILCVTTINNAFIAIEKSKGNTIKIFVLNFGVIAIKITLSSIFAFVLPRYMDVNVTYLAIATLVAQLFMMCFGVFFLFYKNNVLRITVKSFNLNKEDVLSIFKLSLPVFIGRFLFSFGKVYVNTQAKVHYGKKCVGALGISNTIAGLMTNMINSFEDAGSTIVSQNYGASQGKRIQKYFMIEFIYVFCLAFIGMITCFILKDNIAIFFAPDDKEYQVMIVNIFKWECLDLIFTGLSGIANSVLYGFGKTRITMALSMSTLFLFRIPSLLILMNLVKMNYEACGVAMFISNTLTGIISIIYVTIFIFRLPKNKKYENIFNTSF